MEGERAHPSEGLRLVRRRNWLGEPYTEVVATIGHSLADVGYTVVAVTLAEPLRKALRAHLDGHQCSGVLSCQEANALWELLPDGDRILMA